MKKSFRIAVVIIPLVIVLAAGLYIPRAIRVSSQPEVAGASVGDATGVRGVILPHHGLAAGLIDDTLSRIGAANKYSLIVLFAPNHFQPEKIPVATVLEFDGAEIAAAETADLISTLPHVSNDPRLVSGEHAVTLLLPYLARHFPGVGIMPLVISSGYGLADLENLTSYIVGHVGADTLYVASVDFSHDSSVLEGLSYNQETSAAFRSFDVRTILTYDDKHLDSPQSSVALILASLKSGVTVWDVWHDSHSGILQSDTRLSGTSYLVGVYGPGQ